MVEFNSTEELFTAIGEYAVIITKQYSHNQLFLKSIRLDDGSFNIDKSIESDNQNELVKNEFDDQVKQMIMGILENVFELYNTTFNSDTVRYGVYHPLLGEIFVNDPALITNLNTLGMLGGDNNAVDDSIYTVYHPIKGQNCTYYTKKRAAYESALICLATYQFFCQGSLYYKIEINADDSIKITDVNRVDVTDLIDVQVNNGVRTYRRKPPPAPVDYSQETQD